MFSAIIDCRYTDYLAEMISRARRATGDPALLAASLANFWANQGQVDRATGELLRLMEVDPRQAESVKRQILNFPDDEKSQERIIEILKEVRSNGTIRRQVTEMLAAIYFRSRQWEEAYEQMQAADLLVENRGVNLLPFAETLCSEDQPALAQRVLSDLARINPNLANSPQVRLVQAKAWEALKHYEAADSVYSLLTESSALPTAEAQEALIRQAQLRLVLMQQPDAARTLLENSLKRNPRLPIRGEALLLIGDALIRQKKLNEARDRYLEASQTSGQRIADLRSRALVNAARVDCYQGLSQQAEERLHEAASSNPEGTLTNDALDLLELLRAGKSDSTALAELFQAELEIRRGDATAAEAMYLAVARKTKAAELAQRALLKAADLQIQSTRFESALLLLEELISRFPSSLDAPETLLKTGEIYETFLKNPGKAMTVYEKILLSYPHSLQTEEARRRLRRVESTNL
ncbi:MAG: tetratricopeptide repeat protein [bacterium]